MLQKLISDWATANPRIRRVWISSGERSGCDLIALELEPVPDSEETFAVWIAHCRRWHGELEARLGRRVRLAWVDPDGVSGVGGDELIYESVELNWLPLR
jgi:hypothetical protein